MDVGNLSIYQSAHQNVGRTANRSRKQEYMVSLRMCPPTTSQWFSCYHLSKTGNAGACRLHGYPTFFDPRQRLLCVHWIDNKTSRLTGIEPAGVDRYALIIREICSRHVVRGPCEHVVCAASQKRLPVVMCHASAFQSRDCHQSHVCVVCAWLNVGELPRFYNQPQHLAAASPHRMSNV